VNSRSAASSLAVHSRLILAARSSECGDGVVNEMIKSGDGGRKLYENAPEPDEASKEQGGWRGARDEVYAAGAPPATRSSQSIIFAPKLCSARHSSSSRCKRAGITRVALQASQHLPLPSSQALWPKRSYGPLQSEHVPVFISVPRASSVPDCRPLEFYLAGWKHN
jgi:hypothetical protein